MATKFASAEEADWSGRREREPHGRSRRGGASVEANRGSGDGERAPGRSAPGASTAGAASSVRVWEAIRPSSVAVVARPTVAGDDSISSRSRRASAMSCRRCRASLARHRCSRRAHWRREIGGQRAPVWLLGEDCGNRVGDRLAGKGGAPGQHLVQHATEGPDVGALVERPSASLFGAEICRRAEDDAVDRACRR